MSQSDGKSFFTNIWERRVLQFFATYAGVCWGILQFLTFACNRYDLSDSLIDKFLLFAALIVPGVLILFTIMESKEQINGPSLKNYFFQ